MYMHTYAYVYIVGIIMGASLLRRSILYACDALQIFLLRHSISNITTKLSWHVYWHTYPQLASARLARAARQDCTDSRASGRCRLDSDNVFDIPASICLTNLRVRFG